MLSTSRISKDAARIWREFYHLPGAKVGNLVGIASQKAIEGLLKNIQRFKPTRILEIGAGIGTLTYSTLYALSRLPLKDKVNLEFYTIENHPNCLEQLADNLVGFQGQYQVLSNTKKVPSNITFDFIIIDGGGNLGGDMSLMNFSNLLAAGGVIFVEGGRGYQRELIKNWYADRKYIYLKFPAIRSGIKIEENGIIERNKPYHLFVFEPSWSHCILLGIESWTLSIVRKAINRLKHVGSK